MATGTAQEIVRLKSPSTLMNDRLDDFVNLAKLTLSENIFGAKYQYALALLVLHQLALEILAGGSASQSGVGAVGGIKSKKEGELAVSFGGMSSTVRESRMYLMSTQFGQELVHLWNSCIMMPRTRFISGR